MAKTKAPLWSSAAELNRSGEELATFLGDTKMRIFCEGRGRRTRCLISWVARPHPVRVCPACQAVNHG